MSKFNTKDTRTRAGQAPVQTDTVATGYTHEGRPGYGRDVKGELFLLAVSNMVSQDTFYEKAGARDSRFEALVHEVALTDPAWLKQFIGWLRNDANMRTASLVAALEAARAMLAVKIPGSRTIVSSALQRADEPGEAVAYWLANHGRKMPMPVKRGIGDAALRLYNEYTLLKYDTASHGVRFGDVLELTHPGDDKKSRQSFKGEWQRDLFKLAIDRRHDRGNEVPESLVMVRSQATLRAALAQVTSARDLPPGFDNWLKVAGMTWEDTLSLLGNRIPKKDLWEAIIPSMNYMGLLRNLRNFDEAGISDVVADAVAARLADPEQVATSKQFPFRFYSAYKAVQSLRWGNALERALTASLTNVPALRGRTLILVDQSPSMWPAYYGQPAHKGIENHDLAALFGAALALRNGPTNADLVGYGHGSYHVSIARGGAVLTTMGRFVENSGTDAYGAARAHFNGHDRIVVVTDGENNGPYRSYQHAGIPDNVPIYTWNIAGYKYSGDRGAANRHTFGGLTDAAFKMIPLLEGGHDGTWPWESETTA